MKLKQAVSSKILKILDERDMTKYDLSKISGVPQSTISTVLNSNTKSLNLSTLYDLCASLNIELSDFFNEDVFKIKNLDD